MIKRLSINDILRKYMYFIVYRIIKNLSNKIYDISNQK